MPRRRRATLSRSPVAAALSLLLALAALTSCAPRRVVGPPFDGVAADLERLVNEERSRGAVCGGVAMPSVGRVALEGHLIAAAQRHSADQAEHERMSHVGSDGSTVGKRVSDTGYEWSLVAENVAWNYRSPESVVEGWMGSPPHCAAIMNAEVTELGGAERDWYWTLVLAQPR